MASTSNSNDKVKQCRNCGTVGEKIKDFGKRSLFAENKLKHRFFCNSICFEDYLDEKIFYRHFKKRLIESRERLQHYLSQQKDLSVGGCDSHEKKVNDLINDAKEDVHYYKDEYKISRSDRKARHCKVSRCDDNNCSSNSSDSDDDGRRRYLKQC